ncbi:MAG: SH3 domain-containing protein, partial [Christensenellales bacterium]
MQRPVKFQTKFLQKLAAVIAVSLLLSAAPHVAFAADYSAVTTEGGVKVYWDADFSSYAGALPIGTIVTVTKTGGGVAEFTFQSRTGYCALSDLTAVDDIARPAQVNASGVKVYVAPDTASKSASVSKGTRVNVVAEYKSWAMIERNGVGAYMYAGYLTYEDESPAPTAAPTPAPTQEDAAPVLEAVPAVVTDASLPVYKSASASSAKLGTLKKDMEVNVLANNGTWAYIEREDHYGYCRMSGLTRADLVAAPTPTPAPTAAVDPADFIPAVVTANTAVVYRSANTSSESLGTLKKGATLNVVSFNRTWAYVELNGNYGFCRIAGLTRADLIETPAPTPAPTAAVDPKDYIPAVVTAKSVVVYESASASSPRMGTLKEGAELNVVRFDKDWAYVERAGYFGYCAVSALIPKSQLPTEAEKYRKNYPDVQFTATVIEDAIPIYAEPGDTSPAGSLPIAAQVDIYAYNKSWAYLGIGEMRGFAQIKYMSAAKFDTLTSGDSSGDVTKLQRALEELGYFDGVPGGNFNALTAAAVKRFQAQVGLSQTGTADAATQRVLYGGSAPASSMIATALRSGDKGASVERLQTRLFHLGYFAKASSVDGDYGGNTIA